MPNKAWLATHLFSTELEKLLVKGVTPFVKEILNKKLADQYFFIRYWERGPHIRLRFRGDNKILLKKVKPRIQEYFTDYFKNNPSKDSELEWINKLPEDQKWYPNNSIQHIAYEPEVERYGGPLAIETAEHQFQASSNTVLTVIEKSEKWDYERALGTAIQMHLSFAYAAGMSLEEVGYFYAFIYQTWFHRAYYNNEQGVSQEDLKKRADTTLKAFENNFEKQKKFLVNFQKTLWDALVNEAEFDQQWVNKWVIDMKKIYQKLCTIQKRGKLTIPSYFKYTSQIPVSKEQYERMCIYESYVHMTNNRLGILNRDEAFLGYLIKRSIGTP